MKLPTRDQFRLGTWIALLGAFVCVGLHHSARSVDTRALPVDPTFASSDAYLLATLGLPHACDAILAALPPTSSKPILFIGNDSSDSIMTFFLVSSLLWPRYTEQV